MRPLTYLGVTLLVLALAFWAYRENYRTQAAMSEMGQIQREIAGLREDLGVLRAEWAYLNRPERLRELVNLNFERLQLVPLESGQYLDIGNVDYPKPPAPPEAEDAGDTAPSQEQQP
nr:cell division protein FtsL [Paracoccus marinaquae]